MITANVFGAYNYTDKKIHVKNFICRNSIISAISEDTNQILPSLFSDFNYENASWEEQMIYLDLTKGGLKKLCSEQSSDVLIIDLFDDRFNAIKLDDNTYITNSPAFEHSEYYSLLTKCPHTIINLNDMSDEYIHRVYSKFASIITKKYSKEQIIVVERMPVINYYEDNQVKIYDEKFLEKIYNLRKKLKRFYSIFESEMTGCHIIKLQEGTVARNKNAPDKYVPEDEQYIIDEIIKAHNKNISKCTCQCGETKINDIFPDIFSGIEFNDKMCNEITAARKSKFVFDKTVLTQENIHFELNDLPEFKTGRYNTDINSAHFEFFISIKKSDNLYVFPGPGRARGNEFPHFPRCSYHTFLDGSAIWLEDPMYFTFPNLYLGWGYGTEEENYREYSAELIKRIAEKLGVENRNIIFFSSSGGGTQAIHLASMLEGSRSVAINPQLQLDKWEKDPVTNFTKQTGIDLTVPDKWYRNDILHQTRSSPSTEHLIVFNVRSIHDYEQLKYFGKKLNYFPKMGISRFENITFWLYDANARSPHTAFEDNILFYTIDFLSKIKKNYSDLCQYSNLFLLFGELWNNHWATNTKFFNEAARTKIVNFNTAETTVSQKTEVNGSVKFQSIRSRNAYVFRNLPTPNTAYKITISGIKKKDDEIIDIACWDRRTDGIISKSTLDGSSEQVVYFLTHTRTNDQSFAILAGSPTANLTIDSITIEEIARLN